MFKFIRLTHVFCTMFFSRLVMANESESTASIADSVTSSSVSAIQSTSALPSSGLYVLQVLLGLGFVVVLIFVAAWLMKRVGHGSLMGASHMRIMATLAIGTKERLAIVDVAGTQILLGVTSQSINTLHTFDTPIISTEKVKSDSDFSEKLKEILARGEAKP